MASPSMTFNAAGNLDASASLAASASRSFEWDLSAKFAGYLHVKNTPGGTVAGTSGLQVQAFRRYGSTPTNASTAAITVTIPSVASTAASADIELGPGKWHIVVTNLDVSNAVTAESTGDTVDSIA